MLPKLRTQTLTELYVALIALTISKRSTVFAYFKPYTVSLDKVKCLFKIYEGAKLLTYLHIYYSLKNKQTINSAFVFSKTELVIIDDIIVLCP